VLAGLKGEGLSEGLHGHWVQAYYLHLIVRDAGGRLKAEATDEKVVFAALLPATSA
jgi:histidine phosphotransferase ChpT